MWFAQAPTPLPIPLEIQTEVIHQASSQPMAVGNMLLLGLYFTICLALIVSVTLQTSKADGLMQQNMSAPTNSSGGGKGKLSTDERLAKLTTNLAWTFLGLSIFVAYFIRW